MREVTPIQVEWLKEFSPAFDIPVPVDEVARLERLLLSMRTWDNILTKFFIWYYCFVLN